TNLEVNKLKINLSTTEATMTLAADLTTNGLFEINKGTFIVNNEGGGSSIPRTLISHGKVLVENAGRLRVVNRNGTKRHNWYFYDDFINNGGEVKFTSRESLSDNFEHYRTDENTEIIVAYFSSGSKNQELVANGISYFSKIVIDKGVDMTYILSISSNNPNYFKLLGPCRINMSEAEYS